jgi:hypothetical protein
MMYKGGCHCGQIAFEVEGNIEEVIACNCSFCSKRGNLMWFTAKTNFRLTTSTENYATYTFYRHKIQHRFCPTCGCGPFEESLSPRGEAMVAINVRCLNDVDLSALKVRDFNGRKL